MKKYIAAILIGMILGIVAVIVGNANLNKDDNDVVPNNRTNIIELQLENRY